MQKSCVRNNLVGAMQGSESEPSIVDGAVDPCAGSASVATSMNAGGNHGAAAPYDKEESVSGVSRVRQPHESCAVAMEVGGEGGVSDAAACGPLGPGAIQGPTRPVSMRHLRVRVQQWGVQVRLRQCCNRMAVCRRLRQSVLLVSNFISCVVSFPRAPDPAHPGHSSWHAWQTSPLMWCGVGRCALSVCVICVWCMAMVRGFPVGVGVGPY